MSPKTDRVATRRCQAAPDENQGQGEKRRSCKAGQATSYEFLVPLVTTFQESYASTSELEVDVSDHDIREGDRFLLCSDGLNSMIEDTEIAELLRTHHNEPEAACRALVEAANRSGGDDNITVVVVAA